MSDEQRVRTMCGWIGVEISRSRVRTPGKAGYGLYRVRAAAERHWHVPHPKVGPDGEWTGYAFTLEEIERAVEAAITYGQPSEPDAMRFSMPADPERGDDRRVLITVPTRWTSAYRGSRTLGTGAASAPVGEGLTVRQRQREHNAAFQAEHLERREHGLRARHAAKLSRVEAEKEARP